MTAAQYQSALAFSPPHTSLSLYGVSLIAGTLLNCYPNVTDSVGLFPATPSHLLCCSALAREIKHFKPAPDTTAGPGHTTGFTRELWEQRFYFVNSDLFLPSVAFKRPSMIKVKGEMDIWII